MCGISSTLIFKQGRGGTHHVLPPLLLQTFTYRDAHLPGFTCSPLTASSSQYLVVSLCSIFGLSASSTTLSAKASLLILGSCWLKCWLKCTFLSLLLPVQTHLIICTINEIKYLSYCCNLEEHNMELPSQRV